MRTLSQSDINAIADAVAIRLGGSAPISIPAPKYDSASAKRKMALALSVIEETRKTEEQRKKGKKSPSRTGIPEGQQQQSTTK
ncbi:MAG: hypothetical protein JZU65_22655 [Chlorobium sp.]|nr:hypothetical protein [Chlorobium sp.]